MAASVSCRGRDAMPRLRIYCETLPYEQVARPRTVGLLARYGLEIVLAVRPWDLGDLPRVAAALRDAGVPLSIWPMLSDEEGRWANARNAASFTRFAGEAADVLARAATPPRELVFDLEPSFDDSRMLLPGVARDPAAVKRAATATRADALAAAERALAGAATELHDRGVETATAVWPLVALDPPGRRGWQSLLGTPVDALPARRVSVMVYTSLLEGWSRGVVRRRHALALLDAASRRVLRRWGERASISLGCVGTGAFVDEPVYRSPAELAEDVAIVRAAGFRDVSLFDLAGVMRREPAEAWLDAFAGAHDPILAPASRRVSAARTLARAATWAITRGR